MDIETFNLNNKVVPYCICAKIKNEYYSFWYSKNIVLDFIEKICEISENDFIEIYTHNINFDGLIILDSIKDKNISFDLFMRDLNIYWIKLNYLKITIMIRCSYKIIPLSVKKMGLMLNLKKQVFPYKFVKISNLDYIGDIPNDFYFNSYEDYLEFKENNKVFDLKSKTIEYCFRDIDIVHKILIEIIFILASYSGNIKILKSSFSFSSIAYKIYIKKFDNYLININKNDLYSHNYIKNSYYGGRCEVFGNPTKNKKIHYFDYSGMYAQCMMEKFPIGKSRLSNTNLNINDIGFHTIKFKCDDYLPFLPYRYNKLFFPNGIIVGTYWYEEIINAIKYNKCKILEHYSSILYDREEYIFKDYVSEFVSIRKKGLYYNIFGKNMVNGLYGSFALNDDDNIYIICMSDEELESYNKYTEIISLKKIGNHYIIKIKKDKKSKKILDKKNNWEIDNKKRNIAYASIIASKARIKLNKSLEKVLEDGGELYYTDTDSIFAGYDDNKKNCELGDIKWDKVYDDGVFISSKFYYILEENLKLKGVNLNNYSFNNIKEKFYNNEEIIIFDNQTLFEKKKMELFNIEQTKKISLLGYDKRIFLENKKKTKPILIIPD